MKGMQVYRFGLLEAYVSDQWDWSIRILHIHHRALLGISSILGRDRRLWLVDFMFFQFTRGDIMEQI